MLALARSQAKIPHLHTHLQKSGNSNKPIQTVKNIAGSTMSTVKLTMIVIFLCFMTDLMDSSWQRAKMTNPNKASKQIKPSKGSVQIEVGSSIRSINYPTLL